MDLTVRRVDLYHVVLPLRDPFRSALETRRERHALLVRLEADGVTGWGEVAADRSPRYGEETVVTAWHVLRDFFVPAVLGRAFPSPEAFRTALAGFRGHPMARAGLEGAFWDAWCRARGVPLARALGGTRERVPGGVALGLYEDPDALLRDLEGFLHQGYRRVKLKIAPGRDLDLVRAVRAAHPGLALAVDANGAYGPEDGERLLALDGLGLLAIEQPLPPDDLLGHAALQGRLRTPIALDEGIRHAHACRLALELGACRAVCVKIGPVGGLGEALAIERLCRERGVPAYASGTLDTGIGRLHLLALASLPGFTLPGDLAASDRYWHEDLIDPPVTLAPDGTLAVPAEPGIGHAVRLDRVERAARRRAALRAPARARRPRALGG